MKRALTSASKISRYLPLETLSQDNVSLFQKSFFKPQLPVILPRGYLRNLPATSKWFSTPLSDQNPQSPYTVLNHEYLEKYGDCNVPLELTTRYPDGTIDGFKRFHAPLSLFLEWARSCTDSNGSKNAPETRLYLAQCQLLDLSPDLRNDFPTPSYVTHAGKGDIYDTNIWMGVAPTYTPLHRDPNPNLFVQLAGSKRVRLLSPEAGLAVFTQVKSRLGSSHESRNAAFRGDEMMQGQEKKLLDEEIWGNSDQIVQEQRIGGEEGRKESHDEYSYDVHLNAGDGLFIPTGWWHSIKGVGQGITASVNWWFR